MIVVTEHIPAHEMLHVYTYVRPKGITMISPNCPGVLSPGKANVGIIPAEVFAEGAIRLVTRSGTLAYPVGSGLAELGLGNSLIVGIGGDPVPGSSFIDILEKFEADPQTEMVVMVGEIGGDEEERPQSSSATRMSKPVLAYVAGFIAPPGKTMGHAGAIISGSSGPAQAKKEALEACGVRVGANHPDRGRPGWSPTRSARGPSPSRARRRRLIERLLQLAGQIEGAELLDRQLDGRRSGGELAWTARRAGRALR